MRGQICYRNATGGNIMTKSNYIIRVRKALPRGWRKIRHTSDDGSTYTYMYENKKLDRIQPKSPNREKYHYYDITIDGLGIEDYGKTSGLYEYYPRRHARRRILSFPSEEPSANVMRRRRMLNRLYHARGPSIDLDRSS